MRGGLRHAAIRLMSSAPAPSSRIGSTDVPCIVQMQQMLRGKTGVLSLAQAGMTNYRSDVEGPHTR